jgi:hypothetical protein
MPKLSETDLSNEWPGLKADVLIDRTKITWRSVLGKVGLERETRGPSSLVGVSAILGGGTVLAGVICAVCMLAGAPGWLTPVLGSIMFVVYGVFAIIISERNYRRALMEHGLETHRAGDTDMDETSKVKSKEKSKVPVLHQKKGKAGRKNKK